MSFKAAATCFATALVDGPLIVIRIVDLATYAVTPLIIAVSVEVRIAIPVVLGSVVDIVFMLVAPFTITVSLFLLVHSIFEALFVFIALCALLHHTVGERISSRLKTERRTLILIHRPLLFSAYATSERQRNERDQQIPRFEDRHIVPPGMYSFRPASRNKSNPAAENQR